MASVAPGRLFFHVGRNEIPLITEATRTVCPFDWSSRNLTRSSASFPQMSTDSSGTRCCCGGTSMSTDVTAPLYLILPSKQPTDPYTLSM